MLEQTVTSKYFQKSGMDESLTDFEEKKKIFTGPKTRKPKAKKQISKKRIRGQKDIRTLIKPKKNELLTFTKDFNDVCAQGGIDVDSQQLQLAIALSKSLQQTDKAETEELSTNNLSSQERTNRIRRTLQEYGFRIPKAKITLEACKRVKRYRKPYKLLQITEEERLQKISNRYSQVLFENPDKSFEKHTNDFYINSKLYYLATNITYEHIQNNEVYRTKILQGISFSKGNLLRDWSDIPGRPVSPKLVEEYVISMPDIQCSQNELDIILSGTINAGKDILKTKLNLYNTKIQVTNISEINITSIENTQCPDKVELDSGQNLSTMAHEQNRSHSPDIFDDDQSITDHSIIDKQVKKDSISKTNSNVSILDLQTELTKIDTFSQSSNNSNNITKRKSNDFMDLTECVPVTSQCKKIMETINESEHNSMEITECINPISQESTIGNLTKEFRSRKCISLGQKQTPYIPALEMSKEKVLDDSSDDTIILKDDYIDLTQDCNPKVLVDSSNNLETMDLTQSSNSNDLPEVNIPDKQISPDDTIIVEYDDMPQININIVDLNSKQLNKDVIKINDRILDISDDILPETSTSKAHSSINNSQQTQIKDCVANQSMNSENIAINTENDIDLTQSSDSNIDGYQESTTDNVEVNYDSLGKKGDISIDYDEIFDQVVDNICPIDEQSNDNQSKSSNISQSTKNSSKSSNKDIVTSDNNSDFELYDRELNYSIYRSRVDNDFEYISIDDKNEIPNKPNNISCYNNYTINRSLSESDLPAVINTTNYKDKQFNITLSKSACSTPIKATVTNDKVSIKTPTNSEYIIKMGEVTPMLDYEAMSSPERDKELEKYGLKPFKRKRAIQLLTHLYNQTHPVIEQCSEDPVPFKKFKPNSPEKDGPKETNIVLDKENIYCETKSIPDIKDIECSDDWIFQKKEKAKVHSCPVPLHIVFHNYVSCRRHLREAILRYEPINIDVIHKDLADNGYKYNPKDLLKFLDRKCITVKTADNDARNNK